MADEFEKVAFGGRTIRLAGPGSQELNLTGVSEEIFVWEPRDKGAYEIEVRARIVDIKNPDSETDPEVRWSMEVGHGSDIWHEPPSSKTSQLLMMEDFTLPGRGMIWRLASRHFRIAFHNVGPNAIAGDLEAVLQVSILPVWGEHSGVRPYIYRAPINTIDNQHPFPIAAREFKIVDPLSGLPVPPATASIIFIGITGNDTVAFDVNSYSDYRPIPHDAAGFLIGVAPVDVAYR